ncbi:anthrone oxygenase family protein [Mycobacterium sp. SMC-18]|uniref:anthrone oxygenase family protein n=1 Tax=Mycobacterium sp. SMC-18 TaxID=3381629 RepID=UPI003876FB33
MEHIAQVLTVIVVGTLVGVEFGVAAFTNPILERLPDDAYRQARATGSRLLGTVMPFWYIAAAVLLIGDAVLVPAPLPIAAVAVMGVVMALTLTTLVPINNRVAAWAGTGPGEAPTSRELAHRWDRLHWVRVALLLAAFVLVTVPR